MPRNFKLNWKDPRIGVRAVLGALLALNVIAAIFLFRPWGGSAEELERQVVSMRQQLPQHRATLEGTKAVVQKVEKARSEGDQFLQKYMLDGRSTYSTI